MTNTIELFFHAIISPLYIFLEKYLFKEFSYFSIKFLFIEP